MAIGIIFVLKTQNESQIKAFFISSENMKMRISGTILSSGNGNTKITNDLKSITTKLEHLGISNDQRNNTFQSLIKNDSVNVRLYSSLPILKNEEITLSKAYTGCTIPLQITRWVIENNTKREESETIYVTIPKGVDNNEIIIIREKGNILADTNKGDIKLFIKITNDTDFIRNGLDLILNKNITLKEALCGFSFDMKYIDGREFKLNNGNGNIIHNNYNKVIQHMGMKRIIPDNQEHIGNLIINFNVVFPEQLREEQITELSKIL